MRRKKTYEKEPVTIRFKQLANGNQSIYLDIYHDGKRRYEFLKLYLVPETGRAKAEARRKNAETMAAANVIKAQRVLEYKNGLAGITTDNSRMLLTDWMDIFQKYKMKKSRKPHETGNVVLRIKKALIQYRGDQVKLKDIDKEYCRGYLEYINTIRIRHGIGLSDNSKVVYYTMINEALKKAVTDGLIPKNPFSELESWEKPKMSESRRAYLDIEEVKRLSETECPLLAVKQAFLFSCFTGLRISDIRVLKWSDIKETKGIDGKLQHRLSIVQQKTGRTVSYNLPDEAIRWLPEKSDTDTVFTGINDYFLKISLPPWMQAAGIDKHITFHCARHTFGTMMLTLGADLYTTSKLMGHTKIATTEIYAKIVDRKKDEAMNLIDQYYESKEETAMKYCVYYNNIATDREVAEFDTLRQAKSYCNAMNNGKQPYTPGSIETHHCYEVYKGEVTDDSEPVWTTDWFFD